MKAIRLRTEHMANPMGLQTTRPVLSWNAAGGVQSAYEISASVNGREVFDSGKVESAALFAPCGHEAVAKERVDWKIRLWDENGCPGEWAEAWYEIGLVSPSNWQAKWINPEMTEDPSQRHPASYLRRRFLLESAGNARLSLDGTGNARLSRDDTGNARLSLDGTGNARLSLDGTGNARLYITCHGLYAAYLNGQRVGDFVLAPGTDDYRKRLQVQAYDVSTLLKEGENEFLVVLGDGWYRGNVGVDGLNNYYGSDLALLCQLEIDGKVALISDESWEASQSGPIRQNDMQLGEHYDARMEDIRSWHGVRSADFGYEILCGSDSVPILEQEHFPGRIFTAPNGETVIDFGQNLAGYTQFHVNAKAGQKITLWHGETLDENGNFTQSNFDPGDRNKNGGIPQKIEYICKDGPNIYKPSFCIFGFRYAKVETDIDLSDAEFTAIAVYSEMEQTGFFECGNADVNRLFLNSLWSMRSNFCDIPTDCPTRERAGWTGDAGVFTPTGVFLADCYPILRKWLAECRLAQGEDGLVSNIAPVNNSGSVISNMLQGSSGWGDACILVPWALYEAYGDTTILEENYEMMRRWLSFVEKRAQQTRPHNMDNPYKEYLVDQGFHFGEWLEPDVSSMYVMKKNMAFGAPEVATAYYFRSASLMAQIAALLGKTADAEKYGAIAKNARKAYRFTCTKDGKIESDRQCEYVRPIAFGLLDGGDAQAADGPDGLAGGEAQAAADGLNRLAGGEVQAAADGLNRLVEQNNYHLNTGFLSTPYLCKVLADNGHTDTAYRLLLQEDSPSWLYAVKKGATSIWETWDGIRADGTVHDSFNHYSYGAISGWLFGGVCGIELKAGKLRLKPQPGKELGYAKAMWNSPVGAIQSAWAYEDGKLCFDITVPIPASIELPTGESYEVKAGEYHYETRL